MDILNNEGKDATMEYLKQWHYPGEHDGRADLGHGTEDKTYAKDGYIMAWNPYLPYIGLVYDTKHNKEIEEDSQVTRHHAGQRGKIGETPLGQHVPHSDSALKETELSIPENKSKLNGKYKTKEAIKSAIYNILADYHIEGRYNDENWSGIKKLSNALNEHDIANELMDADYEGHGEAEGSNLPTRKIYRFKIEVRDKEGKNIELFLKVTCTFVGRTGTMADREYEVTYYFF